MSSEKEKKYIDENVGNAIHIIEMRTHNHGSVGEFEKITIHKNDNDSMSSTATAKAINGKTLNFIK